MGRMIFAGLARSRRPTAIASTAFVLSRRGGRSDSSTTTINGSSLVPRRAFKSQDDFGLFTLSANAGFDPIKPWRLELLVNAAGRTPVVFPIEYKLPSALILMPDDPPVPTWVEAWRDARVNIAILAMLLVAVTAIFVFQAQLSRSRRAHRLVRNGFLLVVLVWLGWTAGAQLSIVNVINYLKAPFQQLRHRLSTSPSR